MIPGVGDLLRATWRLYRSSIALLSGYLAWLLVPEIGLVLLPFLPAGAGNDFLGLVLQLVGGVLSLWVSLILIRILSAAAMGRHESLPAVIAASRERFWPFVVAGALMGLVVAGGFILLIVPGLMFFVWYAFSTLEAALGGHNGLPALSASRNLVRGRFWPVAWRLLAGPLVMTAWYAILMGLIFVPLMIATGTTLSAVSGDQPPLWFMAFDTVGQTFFLTPLLLAYSVLLYHSLAAEKEPLAISN